MAVPDELLCAGDTKKGWKRTPCQHVVYHFCCGLMRYLRESGWHDLDIFQDPSFAEFRATLDSEMKRVQSLGIGTKKRQAEPLTEEEELLWRTGQLGDHSPQALVDSMPFMNGIYFALRSGDEHCKLRRDPPQIELVERPGQRAYLQYTEDISKNHPGGLKGRKPKPKVVLHHENTSNPSRCFVRFFKLYQSKCPPNRQVDAFYLKPLKKPSGTYWYAAQPIGHSKLNGTVARICKAAGIQGFKTNHSLRATAATRLYQAGVDEQMIMETTGHNSIDGVRSYKRTSAEQQESISDILSLTKRSKPESDSSASQSAVTPITPALQSSQIGPGQYSQTQVVAQCHNQVTVHPDNLQRMFTFSNCSEFTINIQIH